MTPSIRRTFAAVILMAAVSLAIGQGTQLAKYTVATLPPAASNPNSKVQVIDGTKPADCSVGGGSLVVLCTSQGGAWIGTTALPSSSGNPTGQQNGVPASGPGNAVMGGACPAAAPGVAFAATNGSLVAHCFPGED